MDREGVHGFIRMTLLDYDIKDEGEWVMTHCPLALWTHPHSTDRNMSFGIKVNDYDKSIYHCFTCKSKGTLSNLLLELHKYTGEDFGEELDELESGEILNSRLPEWGDRNTYDSKLHKLPDPVDMDYADIFEPAAGHPYLKERGIDDETAEELGLVYDPDRGDQRIIFPVYSPDGAFYGYTGRAIEPYALPRIKDYFGLPKRFLLLGAERVSREKGTSIYLVEGLFDYARLSMFTKNVCAVMHSGLTPQQASILKDFGHPVYVFFDNDEAGKKGALQVKEVLGKHVPLMKVRYPEGKNDPGELSSKEFWRMVTDARLL